MTKAINWPRLAVSAVIGLPLVWLLVAQALSSVSTDTNPQFAVSALSANGLARSELAFQSIVENESGAGSSLPRVSSEANRLAKKAMRDDPLVAKSFVVLALAQPDAETRRNILRVAHQLNRRDLALQGLVLREHLETQDYTNTIATLDQILRVHPGYSSEFFPLLSEALANPQTVPVFADMLDGTSPWHERFINYAVGQPRLLASLAELHPDLAIADTGFDRRLIAGLVKEGEVAEAEALYQGVKDKSQTPDEGSQSGWASVFQPFEWWLVDEAGFRAQPALDSNVLEVSVRSGKGGVFARRLLSAPDTPFTIKIPHAINPADRTRDVRLQLFCLNKTEPFVDEEFAVGKNSFTINQVPEGCEHLTLALWARAWSGGRNLDIELQEVVLPPAPKAQ